MRPGLNYSRKNCFYDTAWGQGEQQPRCPRRSEMRSHVIPGPARCAVDHVTWRKKDMVLLETNSHTTTHDPSPVYIADTYKTP